MMKMLNSADIVRLYKKVGDYSSSVAEQVKTIMKTCLDFAVSEKAVETNMALGVRMPKKAKTNNYHSRTIEVEKTLTKEQVFKLIEGSKNSKIYLMLLFNVVMGLRCSEIIGIKYSDIDFINQKLTIRRQLGRDIKKDDSELDWTLKHLQSRKSEQRLLRVSELLIFLILYMKQFLNKESTIRLVRVGEKLHSKIWGTFVAVLMADQEAKIIIMSISSNCLKNWIYLM